ncbi:MAG: CRISPR-associated endonuclease Cas3'' [Leptospiraceae bacterium]|nr:CRISPR-associated endonuclease Cas3'' [Leptospiraceae bacterium]
MTEPLAHSGGHLLADHLQAVAGLAADFSLAFESGDVTKRWAYLAGLWHDLGKYRSGFQRYVLQSDSPDAHIEGKVGGREKTHSAAGALWAVKQLGNSYGRVLAYLIAGHHAGLDDWDGGLDARLSSADSKTEFDAAYAAKPPASISQPRRLCAGSETDTRRIKGLCIVGTHAVFLSGRCRLFGYRDTL